MACLEDLPLCLTVNFKVPFFSSWRESLSLSTCEQKRLTHPFQQLAIPLEMSGKTEDPFT